MDDGEELEGGGQEGPPPAEEFSASYQLCDRIAKMLSGLITKHRPGTILSEIPSLCPVPVPVGSFVFAAALED